MMKQILPIFLFLAGFTMACNTGRHSGESALFQYDARIDTILPQMTLQEKINMMHGKHLFVSAGVERLGIEDMHYTDGPFGIREELQPDSWAPLGLENDKATFFPTGSALAATWSPELAYAYGTGLAREARMRGKDMILGPAINIQRIPTGGRTFEYLSEDPFLNSRLSAEYTRGVQDHGVAACVKHYAMNNQENNRGTVDVRIGERAMREIYLPAFRAAVMEADAFGVMAAYNKVDGWWCSENEMLLNHILRAQWGFGGLVVSDWNGTHSTVDAVLHGLNVEMPGQRYLGQPLLDSVSAGVVPVEIIDQRVREILRVRLAIEPVPPEKANLEIASQPPQLSVAYNVASKSIVLLENDGILPLDLKKKPVIAVIGDNATRTMGSGGFGAGVKTLYEVTPLQGLRNRIGDRAELKYARGYAPRRFNWARIFGRMSKEEMQKEDLEYKQLTDKLRKEALELAAESDLILFIGGDNREIESESRDRKSLYLPAGQDDLVRALAGVNPRIVTVLVSGAPNDLNVVKPLSKALLISWFNGSEGGNALADVLAGNISPSGHLPFTYPVTLEDSPAYALGNYPQGRQGRDIFLDLVEKKDSASGPDEDRNTAEYSEGSLVGYRWFDTKGIPVMYPFGYGLTYTTFSYANLRTSKNAYKANGTISLSFDLKNTGAMIADEVVQVYVHRTDPSVDWPYKELKAFARVTLEPGEIRTVNLEVPAGNLRYWNETGQAWEDDPCGIDLLVGASAGDIRLKKSVKLKK